MLPLTEVWDSGRLGRSEVGSEGAICVGGICNDQANNGQSNTCADSAAVGGEGGDAQRRARCDESTGGKFKAFRARVIEKDSPGRAEHQQISDGVDTALPATGEVVGDRRSLEPPDKCNDREKDDHHTRLAPWSGPGFLPPTIGPLAGLNRCRRFKQTVLHSASPSRAATLVLAVGLASLTPPIHSTLPRPQRESMSEWTTPGPHVLPVCAVFVEPFHADLLLVAIHSDRVSLTPPVPVPVPVPASIVALPAESHITVPVTHFPGLACSHLTRGDATSVASQRWHHLLDHGPAGTLYRQPRLRFSLVHPALRKNSTGASAGPPLFAGAVDLWNS
nr:hypothetical protein CFP56_01354 [Quercus suber]